ncbi:Acyltransferase [Lysobacter dokdonensis DS-58]|uniref:Acyltransferase n=1 Tax=Lysobacter dokdonensis DS-58 TaxID=1300345 RepID=A0A0A2WFW5_9GAMM|nr:Acyltransferase [Lysobacter dokdonensis DS-58]
MNMHWKQRPEGGGRFAIWLIRAIARRGGRTLARLCLYPIVLYFLALRGPERKASRTYLTRVLRRPATLLGVARHIHCFAATILDRVFLLGEDLRRFDVRVEGLERLHAEVDMHGGVLLFGSHLGSFEVLRVLARERPDIPVRVVLDKGHNAAMTQLLDALNPTIAATVIDAGQDGPSIVLAIQDAIAEGAIVAMLVDRTQPGDAGYPVEFLGAPARLPGAPWQIAAVLHAPVVLAFGLYRGGNRYDLVFEPFSGPIRVARKDRSRELAAMAARYAQRLEHHARRAPYNWFNFYDFWHVPTGAPVDDKPQSHAHPEDGAAAPTRDGVGDGRIGRAA